MLGEKQSAANSLSQRGAMIEKMKTKAEEENIDNLTEAQLESF